MNNYLCEEYFSISHMKTIISTSNTSYKFISVRSVDIMNYVFLLDFESTGSMTLLLTPISPWQSRHRVLKYWGHFPWAVEGWANRLWTAKNLLPAQNTVSDSNVDSFHFRKYRYNVISVIHLLKLMGGNPSTVFRHLVRNL